MGKVLSYTAGLSLCGPAPETEIEIERDRKLYEREDEKETADRCMRRCSLFHQSTHHLKFQRSYWSGVGSSGQSRRGCAVQKP